MFSSQKEQVVLNLSFLNEILYYTTHASSMEQFAIKIVDSVSKYVGLSTVYVIDKNTATINIKYSTMKDMPETLEIQNYDKFIYTLTQKGSSDLNIKQMELSDEVYDCLSLDRRFSIFPLVAIDVQSPIGIMVIDANIDEVEISKLQVLSMALILIANSISYSFFMRENIRVSSYAIETILKIMRLCSPSTYERYLRVKRYSLELAKLLSLPRQDVRRLHLLALLYCIGNIDVSCDILNNEGLIDKELKTIKRHIQKGYHLLQDIASVNNSMINMLNSRGKCDNKIVQVLLVANTIDNSSCGYDAECIKGELEKESDKYSEDVLEAVFEFIDSDRFSVIRKNFEKNKGIDNAVGFVDKIKENIQHLQSENSSLKAQLEEYKVKIEETEKQLNEISKTNQSKNSEKYRKIIDVIFNTLHPMSVVFVQIENNSLNLVRVKGTPINLEYSIQLLSNKKVFQSLSSKTVYISHKLIAFPLFEDEAVCVFLSKDSAADDDIIKNVERDIENIVNT